MASRLDSAGCVISIHAPREGCDGTGERHMISDKQFQSTHPARGATLTLSTSSSTTTDFNPRTPRGVRLVRAFSPLLSINFNPRTPRGVRLVSRQWPPRAIPVFQSTHPARGATRGTNSKSLQGIFQSTHPARGATSESLQRAWSVVISIHAPREGCDSKLY